MKATSPYDLLNIQSIENNGTILSKDGYIYSVYEIQGHDSYFQTIMYNYQNINTEIREGTNIEFFIISQKGDDTLDKFRKKTLDPLVKQRVAFLKGKMKQLKKYIAIGQPGTVDSEIDMDYHDSLLQGLRLYGRSLSADAITLLLYEFSSCDGNLYISEDMSDREKVMQQQISHYPDYVKIGDVYASVLSLKNFRNESYPEIISLPLDEFPGTWRFSVSFSSFPDQAKKNDEMIKRRKFMQSWTYRDSRGDVDRRSEATVNDGHQFEIDQAEHNNHLGWMSMHMVITDKNLSSLRSRTRRFIQRMRNINFSFFPEEYMHDREFFRVVPSQCKYSERQREMILPYFVDCIPGSYIYPGDTDGKFPLVAQTPFKNAFYFDPFVGRNNANVQIFGASGSGKSMTTNTIISQIMVPYVNAKGGRIMVIDNKGRTSSYRKMCDLYNGKFYAFSSDGRYRINPFPSISRMYPEGEIDTAQYNYICAVMYTLLGVTGNSDTHKNRRIIIERSIVELYELYKNKKNFKRPAFKDFHKTVSYIDIEEKHLRLERKSLTALVKGVMDNPIYNIITERDTIEYENAPFVVFDVQGLNDLPVELLEAITFILIWELRSSAFNIAPEHPKFLVFDEVAQLLEKKSFQDMIEELFRTARSFGCSVWLITQNYQDYKRAGIDKVCNINTSTKFFLSHADAEDARKAIAEDFAFTDQQRNAFNSLHTKKGPEGYSRMLVITDKKGSIRSSLCDIRLSPYDYWIGTSDADDMGLLRRVMNNRNCDMLSAVRYIVKDKQ